MSFVVAGAAAAAVSLGGVYMAWKRSKGFSSEPTIGYWKIRGLGAALRMMCYYKVCLSPCACLSSAAQLAQPG